MWRLAILLPAEPPMKGPKKVASSISSLLTAALKLELSISLRLGSQTVKKQKTGVTPGTLNKFSDNRDLVDTTELGETPLVKKPKLTRPGPEFWPSVPSADARLLHSWAFPIHWCFYAPWDVSSSTCNAFPATFYWSYLFIIFMKLSDWCWGCAAVAECLPSMFKTLYLIPKHCKKKPKPKQNNTGASHWLFLHHCDKRYDRKHLREEVRIWADIFSMLWCARHWRGVGVCDRGVWHLGRSGVELKIGWDWSLKSHSNWATSASASSTPTSEVPQFP